MPGSVMVKGFLWDRALEEGRRSQSLPQQTVGSASSAPHELPSQQVPQVQAAPPDSRRSLAGSFRRPDRNRDGERPDRRGSQDRQRSGRLPESIGGAGRMMKRLYSVRHCLCSSGLALNTAAALPTEGTVGGLNAIMS